MCFYYTTFLQQNIVFHLSRRKIICIVPFNGHPTLPTQNLTTNVTPSHFLVESEMEKIIILLALEWGVSHSRLVTEKDVENNEDVQSSHSAKISYEYITPPIQLPEVYNVHQPVQNYGYVSQNPPLLPVPQVPKIDLHAIFDTNPLLAALLLGASLGLSPKPAAPNHPELLPINPYIALLLSQYGRYVPLHGAGKGIYGYAAANNFHNNKPFGAYKVYEDS